MGAADGREAGRGHGLWGLLVHGLKYAVLKMVVMLIYVVSHLYDYAFYPIYFFYYHPWRVRRYQKSTHARREDLDHESAVIFHSLTEPTKVNREMVENGLDTMERVFNHVSVPRAIPIEKQVAPRHSDLLTYAASPLLCVDVDFQKVRLAGLFGHPSDPG